MAMTPKKASAGLATTLLFLAYSTASNAVTPWWAWGEIDLIQQNQGYLAIKLKSNALVGCTSDRVFLRDSLLAEKMVDRA